MSEISRLKQVLRLTEDMSAAVNAGKWSDVSTLTKLRAELMESIFPLDNHVDQSEARPLIEQIVKLNQSVEQRCLDARQTIQTELGQFNKNKKVAAAYQSN